MASRASGLSEYKGMCPLSTMMVNLPCLWGSVSQLPSSHLFIHRVPAKLSNGVLPHGGNPCRLQLLFVPESSLTYRWHQMVLNMSADASPALPIGGLYRYGAARSAIGLGPSRTQPGSRMDCRKPGWILDALLLLLVSTGWAIRSRPNHATAFPAPERTISFSIRSASNWTPFFRIVNMILSNLQAITISDCIFFNGFSARVV